MNIGMFRNPDNSRLNTLRSMSTKSFVRLTDRK